MRSMVVTACLLATSMLFGEGAAAQSSPTIDKILSRGQIAIGHRVASPPFGYIDNDKQVVGYTIEICKYVAEHIKAALNRLDLKVVYVPADPSNRIPLVQNGTIDLECATTGNTVERQKIVAFSYSTIFPDSRIAVHKGQGINAVADLKGKAVAVLQGTVQQRQLAELDRERGLGIRFELSKDTAENFLLLESGRADAAINDPLLLSTYIAKAKDPGSFMFLPDWAGAPENDAIMVAKGDDRFRLLVNEGIVEMIKSGKFEQNYNNWLNRPPYNLPMNDALKRQMLAPNDDPTNL